MVCYNIFIFIAKKFITHYLKFNINFYRHTLILVKPNVFKKNFFYKVSLIFLIICFVGFGFKGP